MKFTCDSCSAQYMVSDDKVGPSGVKVRCKKCGNVIVVRRPREETPAAAAPATGAAPAGDGAAPTSRGLDAELGQAFDTAFGEAPAGAAAKDAAARGAADPDATAPASAPDEGAAAAPAPTEWYVAIGQAQVGPLPLAEVKRKWEAGDVAPDSLVWRPGMADWQSLSTVAELASYLAAVPRASARAAAGPQGTGARAEPQGGREKTSGAAVGGDVSWKPAGASALAALASEEISGRNTAVEKPAQAPVPSGAKSLVDALPDGGGVDPTGMVPLSIKALESTGESKLERRSTVAHRAEEARHRRSVTRAVGVVVAVVLVGAAVGGGYWYMSRKEAPARQLAVAPPAPPQLPPPAPPAAAPAPSAPAVATAPPPPAAAVPEAPAAPVASPPVAAAPEPPAAQPAAKPPREPVRTARPKRREPAPTRVAAAPAPPPARAAAPAPKKKDGLLDFGSTNDSALDEALGGSGSSGRSVYVPPARNGGGALPQKLSPAQINEAVAGRIDSLRRCVSEQKQRDPGASGILKMRWIIAGDGGVRDVKCLTSEYAQGPFAQCISGVVKTIRFPRSATTGQEVTFPFSF